MIYRKPKNNHTKVAALIVALALTFAVYDFATHSASAVGTTATANKSALVDTTGTNLLEKVDRINAIKLDTGFFSDSAYLSLEDRTIGIPDQPSGRPNPFAPIGSIPASKVKTR
jgi:hypothetical protein